ncbi:3-methyladenine DNA glycosylase [Arthrobacter alpinus]|uniref:3-methyladenine DNA glycosylase n=1 Tax=Arthrobacter alpinus TaxID=656366 RepID=A0A0S2LY78_9MICC|nr:DNA-3-methyladenine glycosylase I [Arthrobacter alpinus]ALO66176.1 3-methyladenine DNA glycosylase [Arthrobacter alpinus]
MDSPQLNLMVGSDGKARCAWGGMDGDEQYQRYHDTEWGRPISGEPATMERELFERLSLEAFQSGLSWLTILRKRDAFRAAFKNFDPVAVANFGEDDFERLMNNVGIVRNRLKIRATMGNAKALLALPEDTTLASLLASHAPQTSRMPDEPIAAQTPESARLAKALKKLGFSFVGPTTAYAMMQAVGVVNDHQPGCWLAADPAAGAATDVAGADAADA